MAASTDQVASKCIDGYGSAIGMPQLCGEWMANQTPVLLFAGQSADWLMSLQSRNLIRQTLTTMLLRMKRFQVLQQTLYQ